MDKSNFFAVLPAAVRYNPRLTSRSVLLYALISSLAAANGEAFAANEYLMRSLDCSERTVNRLLAELVAEKYITVRYEYRGDTKEIARRYIRLSALPLLIDMAKEQALFAVIPSHILSIPALSVQAKLLYAEVSAATPTDGYCSKPATFFAALLNASAPTVRRWIKELVDFDALRVEMEYKGESREIARRRIYLTAAADIAEKRRQIAENARKTATSDKQTCDADASNTYECGRFGGMLIFDTTSQNEKAPCKKPRKIRRKRKKASEYLRL